MSHQGRVSRIQQANADSDLIVWGESSTQAIWHLNIGCTEGGLNTGIMVTPSSPHPEAIQLIILSYVSDASRAAILPLESSISAGK